jgi:hypothetical protein
LNNPKPRIFCSAKKSPVRGGQSAGASKKPRQSKTPSTLNNPKPRIFCSAKKSPVRGDQSAGERRMLKQPDSPPPQPQPPQTHPAT